MVDRGRIGGCQAPAIGFDIVHLDGIDANPRRGIATNDVNPSLTLYNVAAHEYGLSVGVYWFVIAAILVAVYMFVQYRIFKGKMDDVGYGEH